MAGKRRHVLRWHATRADRRVLHGLWMVIKIVAELIRSLTRLKLRKRHRGTLFGEIEQCCDIPLTVHHRQVHRSCD